MAGVWRDVQVEAVGLLKQGGDDATVVDCDDEIHEFNRLGRRLGDPLELASAVVHSIAKFLEPVGSGCVEKEYTKSVVYEPPVVSNAVQKSSRNSSS